MNARYMIVIATMLVAQIGTSAFASEVWLQVPPTNIAVGDQIDVELYIDFSDLATQGGCIAIEFDPMSRT